MTKKTQSDEDKSIFPDFTVGVLTETGREEHLRRLAWSLEVAASSYAGAVYVVVVGTDPSVVDSINVDSASIEFLHSDGTAPTGRNHLMTVAETEWVLFVDDDCVVPADVFNQYREIIEATDDQSLGAIYGPVTFQGTVTHSFKAYRHTPFLRGFRVAAEHPSPEWGVTANAMFSRAAVLTVGNFDESNPAPVSGEDVDIGLRLYKAGYELLSTSATVSHTTETWNGISAGLKRSFTYDVSEAWLSSVHPERREPVLGANSPTSAALRLLIATPLLPLCVTVWPIVRAIQWRGVSRDEGEEGTLASYLLADIYAVANTAGYTLRVLRDREMFGRLFTRFNFYEDNVTVNWAEVTAVVDDSEFTRHEVGDWIGSTVKSIASRASKAVRSFTPRIEEDNQETTHGAKNNNDRVSDTRYRRDAS
jgi:hypothetical protein